MANKYKIDVNHARQRRFLRFVKILLLVLFIVLLAGIGYVIVDSLIENRNSASPSTPSTPVESTVESKIEVFTQPYFQFQTDENWKFIANESTNTKFVYRRGTDNLVSADMTVYIDSGPNDTQATRVLPVSLNQEGNRLNASFVSEHCNKNLPKEIKSSTGELPITLNSVRFLCDVDGTNFTVIVGLENGTQVMNFKRTDGTNSNYIIYFRDLRANPNPTEFEDIMDTFQIR